MKNLMTEYNVLKKLGINDFGQLKRENCMHFASILDKMDPKVAQKALEQFPEFAKTSKEILCEYRDIIDRCILSNDASMKAVYDAYNSIMVSLQKAQDKDCLTFEEKKYILEKMEEIADKIEKKDTENKKCIAGIGIVAGVVCCGVVAVLASLLGGDTSVKTKDLSDYDPDPDPDLEYIPHVDLDSV